MVDEVKESIRGFHAHGSVEMFCDERTWSERYQVTFTLFPVDTRAMGAKRVVFERTVFKSLKGGSMSR